LGAGFICFQTSIGAIPIQFIGAPLKWLLEATSLHKLRDWPGLSMALTLPVSVEAVAYSAAACAAGMMDDVPEVAAMCHKKDAYWYKGARCLESGDIAVLGDLLMHHLSNKAKK
jgi:hypothetical protein